MYEKRIQNIKHLSVTVQTRVSSYLRETQRLSFILRNPLYKVVCTGPVCQSMVFNSISKCLLYSNYVVIVSDIFIYFCSISCVCVCVCVCVRARACVCVNMIVAYFQKPTMRQDLSY